MRGMNTRRCLVPILVNVLINVSTGHAQGIRRPFPGIRPTTPIPQTDSEFVEIFKRPFPGVKPPTTTTESSTVTDPDLLRERWNFPGTIGPGSVNSACSINASTTGLCQPISLCPAVKDQIPAVRPVHCSYRGREPIVCCPKAGRKSSAIQDATFSRLGVKGCGKRPRRQTTSNTEKTPLVVGGVESEPFSWPWMAALLIEDELEGWRIHCGASIIGKRYAVTAAHCFAADLRNSRDIDAPRYALRVLVHDRDNGTLITLDKIIIHEDYAVRQSYNDIALLRMSEELEFSEHLRPVCIPDPSVDSSILNGKNAFVTGWGDTEFGGPSSQVLREVKLRIFDNQECDKNYQKVARTSFPQGISDILLCAGHSKGGKDACQGDSGGPLVFYYGARWNLVGLVSFGYGCAFKGFPGVYTRITSFLPWIDEQTGGLE